MESGYPDLDQTFASVIIPDDAMMNLEVISSSYIYKKYNEEIDRESAYEILNEKIEKIHKKEEKEIEKKAKAKKSKKVASRKSTRMNPILKVLTSATFIRGVFQVLRRLK